MGYIAAAKVLGTVASRHGSHYYCGAWPASVSRLILTTQLMLSW